MPDDQRILRDFHQANADQRIARGRYLIPFYETLGNYVFLDADHPLVDEMQRERHIDTILTTADSLYTIDEKIVAIPPGDRPDYDAFALETHSCTLPGKEKYGWMVEGKMDVLLYCFIRRDRSVEAYWIPFQPLREWFSNHYRTYNKWKNTRDNKSVCRIVPIRDVVANVQGVSSYRIDDDGTDPYRIW